MSAQIISGGGGRSAVGAASYRRGTEMKAERTGQTHSYMSKHEVGRTGLMLPKGAPEWLVSRLDGLEANAKSEALWNAVEMGETRKDGTLAREVEVSLPIELSSEDHVELIEDFAKAAFLEKGMVVDYAVHDKEGNPHAHIMTTLRPLTEDGWGPKKVAEREADGSVKRSGEGEKRRIVYTPFWGDKRSLRRERKLWAAVVNAKLQEKGVEARVDHRSYKDRGLDVMPTEHLGLFANAMKQKDLPSPRLDAQAERQAQNAQSLMAKPEIVLTIATQQSSVIDADDVSKVIARFVKDPSEFASVQAAVMGSDQLVLLAEEVRGGPGERVSAKAKYSTAEIVGRETQMIDRAARMAGLSDASWVKRAARGATPEGVKSAVAAAEYEKGYRFSDEQLAAVEHVTSKGGLQCVVGLAGAGKSTMLDVARRVWEQRALTVRGITLAGKAAQELMSASGIASRTWASVSMSHHYGSDEFHSRDVIVVDEAGMVGSREMSVILERAEKAGARVVLVGDPKQLEPIGPGAAFRGIVERTGYVEMSEVRRQQTPWMRKASVDLARGNIKPALEAYEARGKVHPFEKQKDAVSSLADRFARETHEAGGLLNAGRANANFSIAALAHSNVAVRGLNGAIRERLVCAGHVDQGRPINILRGARDAAFKPSEKAKIQVGAGDRLVMLMNDKTLDVKNGTLATVEHVGERFMRLRLEDGTARQLDPSRYNTFDHGYALTLHKSQGATFNKTHVLATRSMNRNLAYVGMTRHREDAHLYYGEGSFPQAQFKGGLYQALSRPSDKSLSTDYALASLDGAATRGGSNALSLIDRAAFGMRRGFDTARTLFKQLQVKVAGFGQRLDRALDARGINRPKTLAPVMTPLLPERSGSLKPLGKGWDKTLFPPMRPELSRREWVDRALGDDGKVQSHSELLKQACVETYKDPERAHEALEGHAFETAHEGVDVSADMELKALDKLSGKVGPAKLGKGRLMSHAIGRIKSEGGKGEGATAELSIGSHTQNLRLQVSESIEAHSASYDDYVRQLETPVGQIRRDVIDKVDGISGQASAAEAQDKVLSSKGLDPELMRDVGLTKSELTERFGSYERFLTPKPLGRPDDNIRLEALKSEGRFFAQMKQLDAHQDRYDLEIEAQAALKAQDAVLEQQKDPQTQYLDSIKSRQERLGLQPDNQRTPDRGDRGDRGR